MFVHTLILPHFAKACCVLCGIALAQAAAEEAARSLVNADEAKSAAQTAADQARAFADTAAGYAGAATVSIGWDQDGFFSIFEQED